MTPFKRDALAPALRGKKILLGISGSIAAFKACDAIRLLKSCGASVRAVLTENAKKFVTPVTLETLSGEPVYTSLWGEGQGTHHIDAARWADLVLVAPATAATIGKLAQGLADDLLSTELLAATCPVLVAPAMNPAMYAHPAVRQNVATLQSRGARIVGPATGLTACGEEGLGRMLEPEEIVEEIARAFYAPATRARVLITMGPTQSPLDPVRYLTNRSSGKMGAALAWAAVRAGHDVTAICGPVDSALELPRGIEVVRVTAAREMHAEALAAFPRSQVFFGAAAVLDWDVANPRAEKIKKERGETPALELAKNPDILAEVVRQRNTSPARFTEGAFPGGSRFIVGFAAETTTPLAHGRAKLEAKGCDAIFINDVSKPGLGFESERNAGWWVSATDCYEFAPQSKIELATGLLRLAFGEAPEHGLPVSLDSEDHLHLPPKNETFSH